MIVITKTERGFRAEGHADDPAGCAAVSALFYALAGGLENVCLPVWSIESGAASVEVPRVTSCDVWAMLTMAEAGFRSLADVRGDVRLENFG